MPLTPEQKKANYDSLSPFQQRVVDESNDLNQKIGNLSEFINFNPIFAKLARVEQLDLMLQLDYMRRYSAILDSRIYRFSVPAV